MDKSTLSRDVEVMRRNGWLEVDDLPDARARPLRLSPGGHALLESVVPAWRKAQDKAHALIGDEGGRRPRAGRRSPVEGGGHRQLTGPFLRADCCICNERAARTPQGEG